MKKRIDSTLLLAVLVLVSVFGVACDTNEDPTGNLSGVVQEEGAVTPLTDITVTLNSLQATTDQEGRFAFREVPVGAMTLEVSTTGFDAYTKQIEVQAGDNSHDIALVRAFALQFNHASILVSDLEQSAMFYKDVLRLEELETPFSPNAPVRFFSIGDHQELHMAQGNNSGGKAVPRIHIAFATQDFDAYLGILRANGVAYGTYSNGENGVFQTRPDGIRQAYLKLDFVHLQKGNRRNGAIAADGL